MPDKFEILELTDKQDPALEQVTGLFSEMYTYMQEHGLMLELSEDGAQKWIASVKKGLGRFGILYISLHNNKISGFAHGSIKLIPDYLGSKKTGVINHVYVISDHRNAGVGKALVQSLEKWFSGLEVHSLELQVLFGNLPAVSFWDKLGYHRELLQCRKMGEET
ncbi:MAG: GNAT family N-acetyltransferase [Bacteroidales bacterium]|nr:GNAT family N-acetyltransferase [Bacteroidales bacterium]